MANLIQGVPLIVQNPNWCGYCCLAMVLQYWGYQCTQEALFNHIFGKCEENEKYSHKAQIGIGNLAIGVKELTQLKVRLYSMEIYEKLKAVIPDIAHKILQSYLAKGIPCIVRLPSHYNVVIGFSSENDTYIFNETGGSTVERNLELFNRLWSDRSTYLSYDSRYLILAIYPEGKINSPNN